MKKILFLLLCTVSIYGQTYQNPTFGTVKTMTAPTVTSTPHLGTVEADGKISKIPSVMNQNANSGVLDFDGFTINADPTKYDIGEGIGYISNPETGIATKVTWAAQTAQTTPYLATSVATYVLKDSAGATVLQNSYPTTTQFRTHIYLGKLAHTTFTTILFVVNEPSRMYHVSGDLHDLVSTFGSMNRSGNMISPNGANLQINVSAGETYREGANFSTNRNSPNITNEPAVNATSFRNKFRNGSGGWTAVNTTTVDPNYYDNGTGILALVPNNKFTLKVVYRFGGTGTIHMDYGQAVYDNMTAADNGISATVASDPDTKNSASRIGWIIIQQGTTSLLDVTKYKFVPADKIGERAATASGVTSLQGAYNNSVTPQITTTPTGGVLAIKQGSGSDTDTVLAVQNGSGTNTFSVTGAGNITGGTYNGYVPENNSNKATDFTTVNNTKYPSVKAVKDFASPYNGQTWGVLGDSFGQLNIYQPALLSKLGITSITNAQGGACITGGTEHAEGDATVRKSLVSRIDAMLTNSITGIIIQGGSNDFHYKTDLGYYGISDTLTYYGALDYIALKIANHPTKLKALFVTPTFRPDSQHPSGTSGLANWEAMKPYVTAMKMVANKYSIQVVDEFGSGINYYNTDVYTSDGIHPDNSSGSELYNNFLVANINSGTLSVPTIDLAASYENDPTFRRTIYWNKSGSDLDADASIVITNGVDADLRFKTTASGAGNKYSSISSGKSGVNLALSEFDGNVLIGKTSNSDTTNKLQVAGSGRFDSGNVTPIIGAGVNNSYIRTISLNTTYDASFVSFDGTNTVASGLQASSGGTAGSWAVYNGGIRMEVNPSGVVKINNLAGSGERVISADSSGNLLISSAPTAPTAAAGTNTTQIATTAFVNNAVGSWTDYTPTISSILNLTSVNIGASGFKYKQEGNLVTVTGNITSSITAANTATGYNITLPVARTNATSVGAGTGSAIHTDGSGRSTSLGAYSSSTTAAGCFFYPPVTGANTQFIELIYDITK